MTEILLATDAGWIAADVSAALGGPDTAVRMVRAGQDVRAAVARRTPDLVVVDLQVGNMGGMAVSIDLHHESTAGRLPAVPVLMLLDRTADIWLARQSQADGWLLKPLDSLRLERAAQTLLDGGTYFEEAAITPA